MKEFFQSIFDSSTERIKNPFIGAYITAFVIYNWRAFFLLLFSDAIIEDKIVVINNEYCCREAVLWPLAISGFYILILPYLNLIFDAVLKYSNTKKEERKANGIIAKLEQKKKEAKYEREIADERAGTKEVENLKNKIDALEQENDIKAKEIVEIITKNNEEVQLLKSKNELTSIEKGEVNDLYSKLVDSNVEMEEVYTLLINPRQTAIRDIKNYLRNNLSNDDFLTLKKHSEDKYVSYTALPLTWA